MKLSDIFTGVSKQSNPTREVQETARQTSSAERVNKQIKTLTPGKVVQGEVVSKNGNEVQLKLSEDITLTARLDKDVNVETGKVLTFEVKNNGSSLSLSPLFANTATADNVFKALQMAGLPVNNTTVTMTETMMQYGMSIDSNSLQTMFREAMANPASDVNNVVQLKQMGLPVNEANLSQMDHYKALTHQLVRGMTDVLQELSVTFNELSSTSGADKAVQMYQDILQTLLPDLGLQEGKLFGGAQTGHISQDGVLSQGVLTGMENTMLSADENTMMQNPLSGMPSGTEQNVSDGRMQGADTVLVNSDVTDIITPKSAENQTISLSNSVATILSPGEQAEFAGLLKNIPQESFPEINQMVEAVQNGTADIDTVLKVLAGMQSSNGAESLAEVFKSTAYRKLFENTMLKEWSIEPGQVADSENVKKLYDKLEKSLDNIRNVLQNNGAEQSTAMKSVTNMSQNLEFMNQMNQMYTYVQLPLQMQEGHTNGELYVYTNKRSLAQSDGNVSAFLHLDMEHLGPVDVYVAMQNERVSTHFTLADDEMLDFLNDHMHILTNRLEKKGYTTSVEMKVKGATEEETSPIERIMQADRNATILTQYAFDVRA